MAGDRRPSPILVFGANGQVGRELVGALAPLGEVVALDRAAADLSAPESLRAVIRRLAPRAVVNAAAYTAVDRAENDAALAYRINAEAAGVIAEEARAAGAAIVHFSTDYVYDGAKATPYVESDATNPLSVYGASKLAGERAIAAANPRHLIFRTSWVVSPFGSNFIKTMLRLAEERDALRVVADQHGVPTTAALLAHVSTRLLLIMQDAGDSDPRWGVYHVVPAGETTWHALARHVVQWARANGLPVRATPVSVAAIGSTDYPASARRPPNSRLDTTRLRRTFGIELPDWRVGVDETLRQLVQPSRT